MQHFLQAVFLLLLLYAILMLLYRFYWTFRFPPTHPKNSPINLPFLSIVIPARNEAENIKNCLDSILENDYPQELFEIIVLDDHSTDDTAKIVRAYSEENVQCISLEHFVSEKINSYKKKAIETAIQFAKGDVIVSTDADCLVSKNWLQEIGNYFSNKDVQFLVMPVKLVAEKENILYAFQSLDFTTMQGITCAGMNAGLHNMCNGANLAYRKSAFEQVNGFSGIDQVASGDDMFLMQKIADYFKGGIHYLKSRNVIVETNAMETFRSFLNQRIRWASKSTAYKDWKLKLILLLVYLFNLAMLAMPILSLFRNPKINFLGANHSLFVWWLIALGIKIAVELMFLIPVTRFFKNQKQLILFPLLQPLHIIYIVLAASFGLIGKYEWKGRTVK